MYEVKNKQYEEQNGHSVHTYIHYIIFLGNSICRQIVNYNSIYCHVLCLTINEIWIGEYYYWPHKSRKYK
jgi:hypothetical protein